MKICTYSRSPALQLLRKSSKSASTTPHRPLRPRIGLYDPASASTTPHRPLRPRRGRFDTLLQQLECGIFGRTAVTFGWAMGLDGDGWAVRGAVTIEDCHGCPEHRRGPPPHNPTQGRRRGGCRRDHVTPPSARRYSRVHLNRLPLPSTCGPCTAAAPPRALL